MFIGTQDRELHCPDCLESFDVSNDLSWIPKEPCYYVLKDGTREIASTQKKWCLQCEQPTACECLPNVNELRQELRDLNNEIASINKKVFGFRHKYQNRIVKIAPKIESIEKKLRVFDGRQSPPRCLVCGKTQILEINLPTFEEHTRRKTGFLHPGCSKPMIINDGDGTPIHVSIRGNPREIEDGLAILLTTEGMPLNARKPSLSRIDIDQKLDRLLIMESRANAVRETGNEEQGGGIYGDLIEKILPEAQQLVDKKPNNAKAHHFLGRTLRILEVYDDAAAALAQAIKLDTSEYLPYAEITWCLGRLGQYSKARPFAEKGVELAPHVGGAWSNLAIVLHFLGQTQAARQHVAKAMELDPSDPSVKQAQSLIYG